VVGVGVVWGGAGGGGGNPGILDPGTLDPARGEPQFFLNLLRGGAALGRSSSDPWTRRAREEPSAGGLRSDFVGTTSVTACEH